MPLKQTFQNLLANYTSDENLVEKCWTEIEKNYANKKRHYHTLQHLGNLLLQLTEVKNSIQSWDTILFTLYYHDVIYNPLRSDNEEKSAKLAVQRMKKLAVPAQIIELCQEQILATKSHGKSSNNDTNYFTDADLSILGQDWDTYSQYYQAVRKEYAIYPDLIYNPGRKKVLQHFLSMQGIYKTAFFINKFEVTAKLNLQKEISLLGG
jgi:predicted metal-dependent HD superfamily phosphohydrolase